MIVVESPGMVTPNLDPLKGVQRAGVTSKSGPTDGKSFGDFLAEKLEEVNDLQLKAQEVKEQFADGKTTDVASVVLAAQKADVAFKALMEIRNKLIDAYDEVIRARG